MKLEDQVCGLELAKRLKELGVKQDSYFWWIRHAVDEDAGANFRISPYQSPGHSLCGIEAGRGVLVGFSAFTVAELGEMLPGCKYAFVRAEDGAWIAWEWSKDRFVPTIFEAKTEADARAAMLVYLIENKLVKP